MRLRYTGAVVVALFLAGCGGTADAPASTVDVRRPPADAATAERDARVADVLASASATWQREFKERTCCFVPVQGVIYATATTSACGEFGGRDEAKFCRADRKVYFSDATWRELARDLGHVSPAAEGVVVAHEIGHVVQAQAGTYGRIMDAIKRLPPMEAGRLNAKLEAQADCYAGIWVHERRAAYSPADIDDAIASRRIVGDDYQQMKVRGYVDPDYISHGSARYRIDWFRRGLARGEPDDCEIFDEPKR